MVNWAVVRLDGEVYLREASGRWVVMPDDSVSFGTSSVMPQVSGYFEQGVPRARAQALEADLQDRVRKLGRL